MVNGTIFQCKLCKFVHECGKKCEFLYFNRDKTKVCEISGLCFEQKLCDVNSNINENELEYRPKVKKDQQIKNSYLKPNIVLNILKDEIFPDFDQSTTIEIEKQINRLWLEFVIYSKEKNLYIHRKDSVSFVVGILFSLNNGMKGYDGDNYIVFPHKSFHTGYLNKKKDYKNFEVSNITYGIKKIKQVFSTYNVENKIRIEQLM
jgi:hypothetical protein